MSLPRYWDEVKCELPSYSPEFADLEIITVVLGDGSLRLVPWQNGVNEFKDNVGEKKAVTARFTFQVAPDDHLIETIWCCSRESIGNPLKGEYATELQAVEVLFLTMIAAWVVIFVLIVRRIIVVSGRRDPNSPIPWIIEIPLRAAALDDDGEGMLTSQLDSYEEATTLRLKRRFYRRMPAELTRSIAHRVARSTERFLAMITAGGRRVWTTGTRLFS